MKLMLIILGGIIGSGRYSLARKLARRLNFHHYPLRSKMTRRQRLSAGQVRERITRPRTDAQLMQLYGKVIGNLRVHAAMYPNMVIDEEFIREGPRNYFLSQAPRFFDKAIFVWIDSDEISARKRLEMKAAKRRILNLSGVMKRRMRALASFQPFATTPPIFNHQCPDDLAIVKLTGLIEELTNGHFPKASGGHTKSLSGSTYSAEGNS